MYFPYLYLAYLIVGVAWILSFHKRQPAASTSIRADLQQHHDRYQPKPKMAAE
jgi:hypothetical protein